MNDSGTDGALRAVGADMFALRVLLTGFTWLGLSYVPSAAGIAC
ncbi:hypothetical protein [Ahniella affigens]|nr:hypothetical protein [Ahniella affigens]